MLWLLHREQTGKAGKQTWKKRVSVWAYSEHRVDSFLTVWMLDMGTKDKSRRTPKEDLLRRIKKGSYKEYFKVKEFFP